MTNAYIIAVDPNDNPVGKVEKMEAHRDGILHRAFSIFIFNSKGELLLQKRAEGKYHSGGLWTNTCCSHPAYGEEVQEAADRRLLEEMGMQCKMDKVFHFIYRAEVENNLIEHEYDHVFFGISDQEPKLNPEEVSEWKYIAMNDLKTDMNEFPEKYTTWLQICFGRVYEEWKTKFE